jgi:hypothetical protein
MCFAVQCLGGGVRGNRQGRETKQEGTDNRRGEKGPKRGQRAVARGQRAVEGTEEHKGNRGL